MAVGSVESLYIQIDRELQGHVSSDSLSCSIFKVPNHLRKINEMAYEPQVISIGPYHRDKPYLKAMEVHKKHYVKMLLNRKKENTAEKYVKALEGLKEKALKFYSESPDQKVGDQFVEMMLFDGCFVVELIRKSAMKELREENDHLLTHFILRTVMWDLLLIENQLPFFILMELFDMTKMPNEATQNFIHMAINCFSIMMPGPCNKKIENHPGIKHLLGLLHESCVSPPESSKGVRLRSPEAMANACSAKSVSSSTTKLSEIVKSLSPYAVRMKPNLSGFKLVSSAKSRSQGSPCQRMSAPSVRFPPIKTSKKEKSLPSNTVLSLDEKVNPLSFSSKVSPPESPKGVRLRSPEATAIACSAKSVSSSTTKPSEIAVSFSSDAVLVSSVLSVSPVSGEAHGPLCSAPFLAFSPTKTSKEENSLPSKTSHLCSAPFLTFSPTKTSKEENSLPSNTVLMTPQRSEIGEEPVSFGVFKPRMDVRSFLSSDCDFSVAIDAPLGVPPSKTSERVNFLPSNTILKNIHHSEMEAESESFVVSGSSTGAIEDNHHRHCSMKLNEEANSRTAKSGGHEEKNYKWQTIRSASELREAGIKFEKIEGTLFDINFEKGVMSIPTLKIVDDTESILRNLVAYEQCYKDISSRHFTDYVRFMDCLINTGKDVELLRRREVIENRLGDNEVIADIFNRICDSVLIAEEDFFYSKIFIEVNKHCRKRWNRWKANLRHNYFNTPWASISVVAAVILLLLTVLQSVYSVLSYYHQH